MQGGLSFFFLESGWESGDGSGNRRQLGGLRRDFLEIRRDVAFRATERPVDAAEQNFLKLRAAPRLFTVAERRVEHATLAVTARPRVRVRRTLVRRVPSDR